LEIANKINTVIFDKTGTLTKGEPEVTNIIPLIPVIARRRSLSVARNDILRLAASIEKGSEHSLAEAIVKKAEEEKLALSKVERFKAIAGHGVEGKLKIDPSTSSGQKSKIILGNRRLMDKENISIENAILQIEKLEGEGKTVMMLAVDGKLAGLIAVADTVKETAKEGIAALRKLGINVVMITGDNKRTANAIAKKLGIETVYAEVLPQDKEKIVRKLMNRESAIKNQGEKNHNSYFMIHNSKRSVVAFVGDGINDAPALAAADIGIAMGTGTDVAIEAGNITLVNKNLRSVASAINLSKKTMRTIKLNLFWAFGYNIVLIPVAMGILYPFFGILLNPIFASVAMATSSISVVANSLLLKRIKI
ncbi:MAG: HAD-IC family P-type ATPase, partial [Patescibacteria group bacterium]